MADGGDLTSAAATGDLKVCLLKHILILSLEMKYISRHISRHIFCDVEF